MTNSVLIGLSIVIVIYLLYRMFFGKIKIGSEYEKTYDQILTSDDYKVKGQYDK